MSNPQQELKYTTWTRWVETKEPKHISVPSHGSSVVTSLVFSHQRIITASDDQSIHVYSPESGELNYVLSGHEEGVWSIAATKDMLVSGSTDRTVRIWDLGTGKCTHVFEGHTRTVRCLVIVRPELVDVENPDGTKRKEKWPKRSLIVAGSRDNGMSVWTLPNPGDPEFLESKDLADNPYHRLHLTGHDGCVRGLAARGRTAVSGSYDNSLRVWDIIDGNCKWVLQGHTSKVYSVALDLQEQRAYSGSMDLTSRIWDITNGSCLHVLTGHTSLVGLVALSPSYFVTASADAAVIIWDLKSGKLLHRLADHNGAITSCYHDEYKVLSGSDGELKMWDIKEGTMVRNLLTGITSVWQVAAEGRWCAAASNQDGKTMLDIWDFGRGEGKEGLVEAPEEGLEDDGDDDYEANARIVKYLQTEKRACERS